jgi:diguanylate cyclase (GGDEF)-like protein
MQKNEDPPFKCPQSDQDCQWREQLCELQKKVDELSDLVSHDPLTGLYNVRHLNLILPQVMERTRRTQQTSCLIMVDLDHFKRINDTWGHEVGNLALKLTAEIMTREVRVIDFAFRYGGEEFVILLPDTRLREGIMVAERIRSEIESARLKIDGAEIRFTASMGIEAFHSESKISAEELIKMADGLLYRAKDTGRNQVAHRDFNETEPATAVSQEEKDALLSFSKQSV